MSGTTLDAPLLAPSISPARRSWRRYRAGILFVLPALILYLIFMVYPFFRSIYFSLTSWNGVTAVKEWVGLANYRALIVDDRFWLSLKNTVIWVIVGTISPIVVGMLLAVLLWSRPKGSRCSERPFSCRRCFRQSSLASSGTGFTTPSSAFSMSLSTPSA